MAESRWYTIPFVIGNHIGSRGGLILQDGYLASIQLFLVLASVGSVLILSALITNQQSHAINNGDVDIFLMFCMVISCVMITLVFKKNLGGPEKHNNNHADLALHEGISNKIRRVIKDKLPIIGIICFFIPSMFLDLFTITAHVDCLQVLPKCESSLIIYDYVVSLLYHASRIIFLSYLVGFILYYHNQTFTENIVTMRYILMFLLASTFIMWLDTFVHDFTFEKYPDLSTMDHDLNVLGHINSSSPCSNMTALGLNDTTHYTYLCLREQTQLFNLLRIMFTFLYPVNIEFALLIFEIFAHLYSHLSHRGTGEDVGEDEGSRREMQGGCQPQPGSSADGNVTDTGKHMLALPQQTDTALQDDSTASEPSGISDVEDEEGKAVEDDDDLIYSIQQKPRKDATEGAGVERDKGKSIPKKTPQKVSLGSKEGHVEVMGEENDKSPLLKESGGADTKNLKFIYRRKVHRQKESESGESCSTRALPVIEGDSEGVRTRKISLFRAALIAVVVNAVIFTISVTGRFLGLNITLRFQYIFLGMYVLYFSSVIAAIILAFYKCEKFESRSQESQYSGIELIVVVSQLGLYIYDLTSIIAYIAILSGSASMQQDDEHDEDSTTSTGILLLSVLEKVLNLNSMVLQTAFMFHASRIQAPEGREDEKGWLKQCLLYVALSNIVYWALDSLVGINQLKGAKQVKSRYYTDEHWDMIAHTAMPLIVFYRFNSFFFLIGAFLDH